MFTGIVEELGTVRRIQKGSHSAILEIEAREILSDLKLGDSVAVNGVCLTVIALHGRGFSADVMHETINRSSLIQLKSGSHVNLERAMAANGRFGGHIVAGHVDGMGTILSITRDDTAIWYTVKAEPPVMRYIIEKGSITIDGISLTVARVDRESFAVSVIPHTQKVTILGERRVGDLVNLENDMIGKYVEKLCRPAEASAADAGQESGSLSMEFLSQCGFL